jgi:DNA repair protein RadC
MKMTGEKMTELNLFNQESELNKLSKDQLIAMINELKATRDFIRGPEDVKKYALEIIRQISDAGKEHSIILALNCKNEIIGSEVVSIGHATGTLVNNTQIFKALLKFNAVTSFIFAHNHPSGSVEPSKADDQIVKSLKNAGQIMDLPLIDSIIVSISGEYYSYSKEGRL